MSDTPIYDQLAYEEAWRDEYFGFRQRIVVPAPESTVSVEILPDTTRSQANKHYPTSSPSWARKKKR